MKYSQWIQSFFKKSLRFLPQYIHGRFSASFRQIDHGKSPTAICYRGFIIRRIESRTISRVMSLDDHLSRTTVTDRLKRSTWNWRATYVPSWTCFGWGLHGFDCYQTNGGLLHRLFTLTGRSRRYISVALSRESPQPDVIRHPCPMKPGLSSPAYAAAIICPAFYGCLL